MNRSDLPEEERLELDKEAIATELRDLFFKKKKAILNRAYRPADRFDKYNFWVAAAEKCIALEADPHEYIEAIFDYCPDPKMILPHMIYGKGMDGWWERYCGGQSSLKERLYEDLKNETTRLNRVSHSWDKKDFYKFLVDDSFFMYPYYRVYFFPDDDEIVRKFGIEAYDFFTTRPAFLKNFILLGMEYDKFVNKFKEIHG
jgi:hypothetical protein